MPIFQQFTDVAVQHRTREIGRLAQVIPGLNNGTNTLFFIDRNEVPADRWKYFTYGTIVCNVRPQKEETNRTRLTFGGNNTYTEIDCGTPTANLLTVKLLLNSIISILCPNDTTRSEERRIIRT